MKILNLNKKAQVSLEMIIVIVFLIIFIVVFENLSESTIDTIKTQKIKTQQKEILNASYNFFKIQDNYISSNANLDNIRDYNSSFNIPLINLGNQKAGCTITVTEQKLSVITNFYSLEPIKSEMNINLSNIDQNSFYCGQDILCKINTQELVCE